jgi:hypothetical protein
MKNKKIILFTVIAVLVLVGGILIQKNLSAHCDTVDGPVVKAATDALEKGNVNLILIWVKKEHEKEIIDRFNKTLEARKISSEIKELADNSFFETVVRLHRDGEGEPYTGIKPAGMDLGTAIPAGDKAIEDGSISKVQSLISEAVEKGLKKHFSEVMEKKNYDPNNVDAGREYVKAYVEYIHYVENLYNTAKNPHVLHQKTENDIEKHQYGH